MAIAPPERIRLKIAYDVPYRGVSARPSNSFYLTTHDGAASPSTESAWHALSDDLVLRFKAVLGDFAQIRTVTCYDVGSDMPVHEYTYSQNGTVTPDSNVVRLPSNCAALMKWTTTGRTKKNHPIYLFNYIHGMYEYRANPDRPQQLTPLQVFRDRMADQGSGITDGTNVFRRSGRFGLAAQTGVEVEWVTDHNLFI